MNIFIDFSTINRWVCIWQQRIQTNRVLWNSTDKFKEELWLKDKNCLCNILLFRNTEKIHYFLNISQRAWASVKRLFQFHYLHHWQGFWKIPVFFKIKLPHHWLSYKWKTIIISLVMNFRTKMCFCILPCFVDKFASIFALCRKLLLEIIW